MLVGVGGKGSSCVLAIAGLRCIEVRQFSRMGWVGSSLGQDPEMNHLSGGGWSDRMVIKKC